MAVASITSDNVSTALLKETLDTACMNTFIDSDGDVGVKEQCTCYVLPNRDQRRIRLLTVYRFTDKAREPEKMFCANKINSDYILVRASASERQLVFTYDLSLEGDGVTPRSLVMLIKRFCSIVPVAALDYGQGILE